MQITRNTSLELEVYKDVIICICICSTNKMICICICIQIVDWKWV